MLLTTARASISTVQDDSSKNTALDRRHERHKLDQNRPSSASMPHGPCCSQSGICIRCISETAKASSTHWFPPQTFGWRHLWSAALQEASVSAHTKAQNSKLLGCDEPITIQNSEVKQPPGSFNLFLQCLKLHIIHWALAHIQAVT